MPKKDDKANKDKPIFSYDSGTLSVTPQTSYLGRTFINPIIGPAAIVVNKNNVNILEIAEILAKNQYMSKSEDGKSKLSISKIFNPFKAVRLACNIAQFGIGNAIDSLGPDKPGVPERIIAGTLKAALITPVTMINTVIAPLATIEEVPDRISTALGLKEAAKASSAVILGRDSTNTFDSEVSIVEAHEPEEKSSRATVIRSPSVSSAEKSWSSAQTESTSRTSTEKKENHDLQQDSTSRLSR